jgi:hypothetical protein
VPERQQQAAKQKKRAIGNDASSIPEPEPELEQESSESSESTSPVEQFSATAAPGAGLVVATVPTMAAVTACRCDERLDALMRCAWVSSAEGAIDKLGRHRVASMTVCQGYCKTAYCCRIHWCPAFVVRDGTTKATAFTKYHCQEGVHDNAGNKGRHHADYAFYCSDPSCCGGKWFSRDETHRRTAVKKQAAATAAAVAVAAATTHQLPLAVEASLTPASVFFDQVQQARRTGSVNAAPEVVSGDDDDDDVSEKEEERMAGDHVESPVSTPCTTTPSFPLALSTEIVSGSGSGSASSADEYMPRKPAKETARQGEEAAAALATATATPMAPVFASPSAQPASFASGKSYGGSSGSLSMISPTGASLGVIPPDYSSSSIDPSKTNPSMPLLGSGVMEPPVYR